MSARVDTRADMDGAQEPCGQVVRTPRASLSCTCTRPVAGGGMQLVNMVHVKEPPRTHPDRWARPAFYVRSTVPDNEDSSHASEQE